MFPSTEDDLFYCETYNRNALLLYFFSSGVYFSMCLFGIGAFIYLSTLNLIYPLFIFVFVKMLFYKRTYNDSFINIDDNLINLLLLLSSIYIIKN